MRKQIISLFLSVVMVFTVVAGADITAFSEANAPWMYSVISQEEKTCKISMYDGTDTDLTIPSEIDGYTVIGIGREVFSNFSNLIRVTIPEGVQFIERYAFYDCTALERISIPNGMIYIEDHAFAQCTALTSCTIPASVENIENDVFENCISLIRIDVAPENGNYTSLDGVLFNKEKTKLLCYPANKTGKSYTVPDCVTTIGSNAFMNCTQLKRVVIPASVSQIESYALGYYFDDVSNYNSERLKVSDFKIFGKSGSVAETYAQKCGFAFTPLQEFGDINNDGKTTAVDVRWVLQVSSGARTLDDVQSIAADVNGDGKVTAVDARWILQASSGARTL